MIQWGKNNGVLVMEPKDLCILGQFSVTEPHPCPGFCSWIASILSPLTLGMGLGVYLTFLYIDLGEREKQNRTRERERKREMLAMGMVTKHLQRTAVVSSKDHR